VTGSPGPTPSPGRLILVATPIGNLGDLSPRAVTTLAAADVVCCEDTRRTRALLSHAGVHAPRLVSLHGHNETARIPQVLARLSSGATVAVVSDAGTPAVSDPGSRLVAAAVEAGATVSVVPGPSAPVAALVASGLATDRFCVEGFLPRQGGARRRRLGALVSEPRTVLILESPTRLGGTLADLARECGPERRVAVARELTKVHEEIWRGTLGQGADAFAGGEVRGEVVIVLEGAPDRPQAPGDDVIRAAVRTRLDAGDTVRDAAGAAAAELGVPRRRTYAAAVELRHDTSPPVPEQITDAQSDPAPRVTRHPE
jgi:16S rRNA (cytidine1402-2'-O)-methyltransferase